MAQRYQPNQIINKSYFSPSRLKQLEEEYNAGRYKELEKDLESFIIENKSFINSLRTTGFDYIADEAFAKEQAVLLCIVNSQCINLSTENRKQVEEIEKEIWIRGEKMHTAPDREKVAIEWCRLYAHGWKEHWILAAVYIFQRDKKRYLKLLD
jgi:hypothetical protein